MGIEEKTYLIEGRGEIGETYLPEDFVVKGTLIIRFDELFFATTLKLEAPPAHLEWQNKRGIEVDISPSTPNLEGPFRIKGFGKPNNSWEGNARKNFGEWRVKK